MEVHNKAGDVFKILLQEWVVRILLALVDMALFVWVGQFLQSVVVVSVVTLVVSVVTLVVSVVDFVVCVKKKKPDLMTGDVSGNKGGGKVEDWRFDQEM
jgi:hypothetical protein